MCVAQTVKRADLVSQPPRAAPLDACHHLLSDDQHPLEVTGCGARLAAVWDQLQVELRRRMAGSVIRRPAWKNLVFVGAADGGKSRAAALSAASITKSGARASQPWMRTQAPTVVDGTSGPLVRPTSA